MTNQHPITPPPELVWEWTSLANEEDGDEVWISITTQAARWGAEVELEACVNWLIENQNPRWAHVLHSARRPKPPRLKEQALHAADLLFDHAEIGECALAQATIRRALEALPND